MSKQWGLCKDCCWWQLEPREHSNDNSLGLCIEEKLQAFKLRVSGASGCVRFQAGEHPRAKGSSAEPPTAHPQR